MDAVNVNPGNLVQALATLENSQANFVQGDRRTLPATTAVGTIDATVFPSEKLFSKSGLWINIQQICSYTFPTLQKMLISRNNLAVTVFNGNTEFSAWVTRTDTNDVVPNTVLKFYGYPYEATWKQGGLQPADIQVISTVCC